MHVTSVADARLVPPRCPPFCGAQLREFSRAGSVGEGIRLFKPSPPGAHLFLFGGMQSTPAWDENAAAFVGL
jgi:hypothetical protein